MDIKMFVSRVVTNPVAVTAIVDGEEMSATVSQLEVHLIDETSGQGSWTLRFMKKADIADAREKFVQGELVTLTV